MLDDGILGMIGLWRGLNSGLPSCASLRTCSCSIYLWLGGGDVMPAAVALSVNR